MSRWSSVRASRLTRPLLALVVVIALVLVAVLVPHPSVDTMRQWSASWGAWFPIVFFALHTVACIAPIPRTIFTISAAILFGPVLALTVTVLATTLSAVFALLLVRAIGRDIVAARLTHPALASVDGRLARRGWLAVGSLRLIAPVPFSVVNYCSGVSAVRVLPFTIATFLGVVPGTLAIVLLSNAIGTNSLSADGDPRLFIVSGVCIALGAVGLVLDARLPVRGAQSVTDQPQTLDTEDSSLKA